MATYAAGSQNNSAVYYTTRFPGQLAPAAQTALFPTTQTGTTDPGEIAFKWYEVTVDKTGNIISWLVDGNLIASSSLTGVSPSGNNIFLGMFDSNAASSTEPNDFLNTAIYDNLVVVIPEPTTLSLALLGGMGMLLLARRRN